MHERHDWTLFRNLESLGQKAGVARADLPKLIVKEVVDNAYDVAGSGGFGLLPDNGFWVEDAGPGFDPDDLPRLFCVNRPLISSKYRRLPSRGALGNGLRVVAGAVLATGGSLTVLTRGRIVRLVPRIDTGETTAEVIGTSDRTNTYIEVRLGRKLPIDEEALEWAYGAETLAQAQERDGKPPVVERYKGLTSCRWYDSDAFYELLNSARGRTVRDVVADFDGCTGTKAGKLAAEYRGRGADTLTFEECERLLAAMREIARPVKAQRLGTVGKVPGLPKAHAVICGSFEVEAARGSIDATLPCVVEAWAELADEAALHVSVNRTPITAEVAAYYQNNQMEFFGCDLDSALPAISVGRRPLRVWINIEAPFMPITTDGKAPDLGRIASQIEKVVAKAVNRAKRLPIGKVPGKETNSKIIVLEHLQEGIDLTSGGRKHRFSQRQLFYRIRPFVMAILGVELQWKRFQDIITGYESEQGDIPLMYRDTRGVLYHPHTREEIPLGTLAAEAYRRPEWNFNKILYCEKEGLFEVLRHVSWPERNDCALLTSKGYATRAVRDVLDLLGESGEAIQFFCIHDADAYGTRIYQALQYETQARPGRKVKIENLGLEPAEAIDMGLEVEVVPPKHSRQGKLIRKPVAEYVQKPWWKWLQGHRVELNAMTSPQFLEWLDRKFAPFLGKLVPPPEVLTGRLREDVRDELRTRIMAQILREAGLDRRIEGALERCLPALEARGRTIAEEVRGSLLDSPEAPWNEPVRRLAVEVVERLVGSSVRRFDRDGPTSD